MTPELQMQYQCIIGQDYPAPLMTIESALKQARAKLAQAKHGANHSSETKRIIEKHASRKGKFEKKRNSKKVPQQPTPDALGTQQSLF